MRYVAQGIDYPSGGQEQQAIAEAGNVALTTLIVARHTGCVSLHDAYVPDDLVAQSPPRRALAVKSPGPWSPSQRIGRTK
jgi:hypothetical protein